MLENDESTTSIQAVNCADLINSWTDIEAEDKAAMIAELVVPELLCPNITSFNVRGSEGSDLLSLLVTPKQPGIIANGSVSLVQISEISRVFDPKKYK